MESVQCITFYEIAYLAPKHTEVTFFTLRGHMTNRFAIGHLLLVVYWNRASLSYRFRDIPPPKKKPVRNTQTDKRTDTHVDARCK